MTNKKYKDYPNSVDLALLSLSLSLRVHCGIAGQRVSECMLSVLSKLIEKHVHVQLNDYLEKHLLIHPFQSGFRCKHSCNTALVRLTHSWLTAMNRSEVSGVIFLDLKKAFDGPCGSQYHDVQAWMLPSEFKFSTVFQIVS